MNNSREKLRMHPSMHLVGILVLLCIINTWSQESIYVFSNSLAKPNVIEKALAEKVKGSNIKVFARFADFQAMVAKDKPAVVIAPKLAMEAAKIQGDIALSGLVKGKDQQSMMWVSIDQPFEINSVSNAQVGLLDIAGRTPMRDFLNKASGPSAKIKLASKLEDLLPMLTFKSAEVILVTQSDFEELKGRTQAKLVTVPSEVQMSNVVVIKSGGVADKWIDAIKKLSKNELSLLGVESWK